MYSVLNLCLAFVLFFCYKEDLNFPWKSMMIEIIIIFTRFIKINSPEKLAKKISLYLKAKYISSS